MIPIIEPAHDAVIPVIGSELAGGIDLRADAKNQWIEPNQEYMFSTGVRMRIPKGWVGLVFPRSGLGTKYKLRLLNTVGVIDADYRGLIKVACTFEKGFWMDDFERICQIVIVPCRTDFVLGKVPNDTERGESGFGESGRT